MVEFSEGAATVVQSNPVRKVGPRKRIWLLDVVQKLDQLVGAGANLLDLRCLFNRIEIGTHVVNTAARGRNDVIEAGKIAHEQRLRVGAVGIEPAVCHWLPATGLVA